MLMIIFGAGASYDSAPSLPVSVDWRPHKVPPHRDDRPPLADQLFEARPFFADIMQRFPPCLDIVPRLRHRSKEQSVEQALELLQAEAVQDERRLIQLAAVKHYLQAMFWECLSRWAREHYGVTNYKALLDHVELRRDRSCGDLETMRGGYSRVCLVSFNYDTMLEEVASDHPPPRRQHW